MKPYITIVYCPKCGWLLRAAWIAQELLTTFTDELSEVRLRPAEISGTYQVWVEDKLVFDRKTEGHFPEAKPLKQLIRDLIAPQKSLGHSDR
jgi:selenoprotein W-related protein